MRIATNTAPLLSIGSFKAALDMIKEAGFQTYDATFSWKAENIDMLFDSENYVEKVTDLRNYADSLGLECNQIHGIMNMVSTEYDEQRNLWGIQMAVRDIEISCILGAKYVVFHPFYGFSEEEHLPILKYLLFYAHKYNVKIALENMPTGLFSNHTSIKKLIDLVNDDYFVLCLDVGHAEINKEPFSNAVSIIHELKDKVQCLHIHDNNHQDDEHQLPFTRSINFAEIFKALKEENYQGDVTMEADNYLWGLPKEERQKRLLDVYQTANKLANSLN